MDDSAVSAAATERLARRGWVRTGAEGMWENPHDGIGPLRLDEALEVEARRSSQSPGVRQRRGKPSVRLAWLEAQLEMRDEIVAAHAPRWYPGGSPVAPEEAVVTALDALVAAGVRESSAAALAQKRAYRTGVEAGALGAVVTLGLLASAVALGYALWEKFLV
jgi:hypothetical protein